MRGVAWVQIHGLRHRVPRFGNDALSQRISWPHDFTQTPNSSRHVVRRREAGRGKRRPMCSCIVGVGEGGYAKGRKPGQADCRAPKRARRTKHHPCVLGGSGTANTTLYIRCMRHLIRTMCCSRWAVHVRTAWRDQSASWCARQLVPK